MEIPIFGRLSFWFNYWKNAIDFLERKKRRAARSSASIAPAFHLQWLSYLSSSYLSEQTLTSEASQ